MSNYGRVAKLNFTEPKIRISNDKPLVAIEIEDDTDEGDLLILNLTIPLSDLWACIFGVFVTLKSCKL